MEYQGIDVSEHQGIIDWDKVKASGIYFAMLRIGYGKSHVDTQFERNVRECERVGIKWGCYLYSYALTLADAKAEAEFVLRVLNGRKPVFPVAFDMEDADGYKKRHGMPNNQMLVEICYTFLSMVESAGHYVSLYASLSWLNNVLVSSKLDRFDKWVAQWNTKCDYKGVFHMWQYSSNGSVSGISGNVDLNKAYFNFRVGGVNVPKVEAPKVSPVPLTHKVVSGNTLSAIALRYRTSVAELLRLNPQIKDKNKIYVGQVLRVR